MKDIYGGELKLPKTNWKLFDQLIGNLNIVDSKGKELMNPFEVCKNIFELTAQYYNIKYVEEQVIRQKYEGRLIARRAEITNMEETLKYLAEHSAKLKSVATDKGDKTPYLDELLLSFESKLEGRHAN